MAISPLYGTAPIAMTRPAQPLQIDSGEGKLPTVQDVRQAQGVVPLEPGKEVEFGDLLQGVVGEAARLGHVAGEKSTAFARGTFDDLHGTMISAKQAGIALKLVGSVRNQLLDAFHELWRISV